MDVLISWSGKQSQGIAEYLQSEWLPSVVPGIRPWVSSLNIDKGKRWFDELSGQLDKSQDVIVVVTPSNITSPWIYYEVGRVEGHSPGSSIFPYLIGVEPGQLNGNPLSGFQMIRTDRGDTLHMLKSINKRLSQPHDEGLLEGNFKSHWSKLERRLDRVITHLGEVEEQVTEIEQDGGCQLEPEARRILLRAADHDGMIFTINSFEGFVLQIGPEQGYSPDTPREEAEMRAAIEDLVNAGLISQGTSDPGFSRYMVTREGYRVADMLPRESNPAPTDINTRQ